MYVCPSDKTVHLKQHVHETFSGLGNVRDTVSENAGYKMRLFSFCLSDVLNFPNKTLFGL